MSDHDRPLGEQQALKRKVPPSVSAESETDSLFVPPTESRKRSRASSNIGDGTPAPKLEPNLAYPLQVLAHIPPELPLFTESTDMIVNLIREHDGEFTLEWRDELQKRLLAQKTGQSQYDSAMAIFQKAAKSSILRSAVRSIAEDLESVSEVRFAVLQLVGAASETVHAPVSKEMLRNMDAALRVCLPGTPSEASSSDAVFKDTEMDDAPENGTAQSTLSDEDGDESGSDQEPAPSRFLRERDSSSKPQNQNPMERRRSVPHEGRFTRKPVSSVEDDAANATARPRQWNMDGRPTIITNPNHLNGYLAREGAQETAPSEHRSSVGMEGLERDITDLIGSASGVPPMSNQTSTTCILKPKNKASSLESGEVSSGNSLESPRLMMEANIGALAIAPPRERSPPTDPRRRGRPFPHRSDADRSVPPTPTELAAGGRPFPSRDSINQSVPSTPAEMTPRERPYPSDIVPNGPSNTWSHSGPVTRGEGNMSASSPLQTPVELNGPRKGKSTLPTKARRSIRPS
ncbi:hypothetical protein K402DRAFT_137373 [Aulographum hederae CBS 113979]|uniref:Uncharacterized protein n=1 Tax=Aulographum hederae CBS 113979 TaxID=1176131 RepID=A0A6G1GU81_9PEZI|nr:hypothetical protein K402DRAFT_137373 [Aulographum hederae CBS 113979]